MAAQIVQALGVGTTDATAVTSGASGAKGAWASLGVATVGADWFDLLFYSPNSTPHHLIDVAIGASGAQVVIVENIYVYPQSTIAHRNSIPVAIPKGAEVWVRSQATSASQPLRVSAQLFSSQPAFPAGLSKLAALNPDLANTRPTTVSTPLTGVWTELVSSSARAYRGLGVNVGYSGAAHATAQRGVISVGVGGSGSEQMIGKSWCWMAASASPILNGWFFVPADIPAGSRICARVAAATPGTDTLRIDVMGGW